MFAIKIIDKKEIINRDKVNIVFNERKVMMKLHSDFTIKLHYAF